MKKRLKILLTPIIILIVIAMVISIMVGYFGFISDNVELDSRRHLEDVYGLVSRSFSSFIDTNWEILDSCNDYIDLLDCKECDAMKDDRTIRFGQKSRLRIFRVLLFRHRPQLYDAGR